MKNFQIKMKQIFFLLLFNSFLNSYSQKRLSEGSIRYEVAMGTAQDSIVSKASFIQLLKGSHYRSELSNNLGKTTTIFDMREGNGCLLREYGAQKIMIPMNRNQWERKAEMNKQVLFKLGDEKKEIIGYPCTLASAVMEDSSLVMVFFTKELIPENVGMELQFSQLPGMVLEYRSIKKKSQVTYTAVSINFEPVPVQKFDQPKTGFRVMEFEESKNKK